MEFQFCLLSPLYHLIPLRASVLKYAVSFFLIQGPTSNQSQDSGIGSFFDPTLFIILGAMALMFIVMCVVLQLFAK